MKLGSMRFFGPAGALLLATVLTCGGAPNASAQGLSCSVPSVKSAFGRDPNTTVLFAGIVKKGDPYPNAAMEQVVFPEVPSTYKANLCHVKLLVGPGNGGPEGAVSTTKGIGIEIWLPEKAVWNHTIHAIGGAGWQNGTEETVTDKISSMTGAGGDVRAAPRVAAEEGSVTSTTDSGYPLTRGGGFLVNPDGSFNTRGLNDWVYRALHEQALKTKAITEAYYGAAAKYAFFDGASGGGHQAFAIVQNLPDQYDGVLARVPVLNWNERVARLYPALVIKHDLNGKPLSKEQLDLVSNAAIAACDAEGGQHLGFIIDNSRCRYDPTKDRAVLCQSDGGVNHTPACVTHTQALAVNKVWYGMTSDGSVPDPAKDNGWDFPLTGVHLWYGPPRGMTLAGYFALSGDGVAGDNVAAVLGDPKLKTGWKDFSYGQLATTFEKVRSSQPRISSNNPDLSAFRAHGGKLMAFVYLDDTAVLSLDEISYYEKVLKKMGGLSAVQPFYRMYLLPGLDHGPWNGTSNPDANPPVPARGQLFEALVNWVEKKQLPTNFVATSSAVEDAPLDRFYRKGPKKGPEKSLPICPYPNLPTYVGDDPALGTTSHGDIFQATSYTCK